MYVTDSRTNTPASADGAVLYQVPAGGSGAPRRISTAAVSPAYLG